MPRMAHRWLMQMTPTPMTQMHSPVAVVPAHWMWAMVTAIGLSWRLERRKTPTGMHAVALAQALRTLLPLPLP